MSDWHEFLQSLTVVLAVAAVTTVLFQRLRQSVVLGYIIAGVIVGPHVLVPLVADQSVVRTLSELGVILLMFFLGLDFSVRKLARVGPPAGLTALLETSTMLWLGFVIGRLLGWTSIESLFAGSAIAISSTTIIAKAFEEQRVAGKLRDLVFGILIVEDLMAVLLITVLTALASGTGLAAGQLAATVGRLAAFLVGLIAVGMLVVPRAMRAIVRLKRRETTLVASIGICFTTALLAQALGYSVALGAFIAGSLIGESGVEDQVKQVVEPVRDMFAAVFFVSVGMLIDPALIARHWQAVAVLTVALVLGKVLAVSVGAFLTGNGMRTSVQAGQSLAQIGEFSFVIAGLGLSLRATGEFLYPVVVTVSAVTTLLTPWLIRGSGPRAAWVDGRLPKSLQTFAALYGGWVEALRNRRPPETALRKIRGLLRLLLLDAAVLAAIFVGTAAEMGRAVGFVRAWTSLSEALARALVIGVGLSLAAPFGLGVLRVGGRLGIALATLVLPPKPGPGVDLALAPRRVFVTTLQLASVLLVGAPLIALTQPFLPGVPLAAVLALLVAILGVAFWRSAANLHGHVRAGAQVIVAALAAQAGRVDRLPDDQMPNDVTRLLPGFGSLVAVRLDPGNVAIGQTLAQLNLRGLTGATVLGITRREGEVLIPSAQERLRSGDVLALAGAHDAIEAAKVLLRG